MAWATIENPKCGFIPVPDDGIRVSTQSNSCKRKRIVIVVGPALARGIGLTEAKQPVRIMVGQGGTEEGKVAVVNDRSGAFTAHRRTERGTYEIKIASAAAQERFRQGFEKFERTRLEAIKPSNGQPPYFSFLAGDMLAGADDR